MITLIFRITGPHRDAVIEVAHEMGFGIVYHTDTMFEVTAPTAMDAYRLGLRVAALLTDP